LTPALAARTFGKMSSNSGPQTVLLSRRHAAVVAVSLALVTSLLAVPLASASRGGLSATGVLRVASVRVAASPGLSVLAPDGSTTNTIAAFKAATERTSPPPVGRLLWFGPPVGGEVRAGQVIARIDPRGGALFARRAAAQVEVVEAGVGLIDDGRSKLEDARSKALDAREKLEAARAKLLAARATAGATFAAKMGQGRAAGRKLAKTIAGLKAQEKALVGKLALAEDGLTQALAALAAAQALPDSDPTKVAKVAAAQAALAQAQGAVAGLQAGLAQLRGGLAAVEVGLSKLQAGLAKGTAAFQAGMAKLAAALAQMAAGFAKIEQGLDMIDRQLRVLEHMRIALQARVRQAQAIESVVRVLGEGYVVRSPINGYLVSQEAQAGQLLFARQAIAFVAPAGKLKLDLFVPLDQVRAIQPGDAALVRVDGVARAFRGRVKVIADQVDFVPTSAASAETHLERTVRVELDVDDPSGVLKPGMAADATVGGTA
jgi:multidrug resistance efflux pump